MTELTLHFDNASEADDVLAPRGGFLRQFQEKLALRVTARDNWVKLSADTDAIAHQAESVIEMLRFARGAGTDLRGPTRYYIMDQMIQNQGSALRAMIGMRVDVMTGKRPVFPKTIGQAAYLQAIGDHDVTFGIGPAGTGKTYLAMAKAVQSLLNGDVNRILLTRPAVEAGEALGFLPGDLNQKILPYLRPLYDALHDMIDAGTIEQFIDRGVIEVAPLAYMRGRTLNKSFIVLDEAQNTTEEQMLMFLTRIGFDSKCVVNGDPSQVDLPSNKRSGLREAIQAVDDLDDVAVCYLSENDVVRHDFVQKIIRAYQKHRENRDTGELR